ncbi:hypothetical protein [Candidatus Poriferisocius sp.]|uniref:hypothetical protein n=1 Tax=Candidatus Poriferisocius sp. TaxID=3101276 RepID=UPI003B01665C
MTKGLHSKKEVRRAIAKLQQEGWSIVVASGGSSHTWGSALCPSGLCRVWIKGTPRNAGDHAKQLLRALKKCPHC